MNHRLQEIYEFFKPMKETVVWSNNKDEVCMSWMDNKGYVRWFEEEGQIYQECVET